MKRKKKKRLPVVVVRTEKKEYSYSKFVWICMMAILFLMGNLQAFFSIWNKINISKILTALAILAGALLVAVTQYVAKKDSKILAARALPVLFLFLFGVQNFWEGMRMYLNQIINGWNHVHKGGMVLFAGSNSDYGATIFSIILMMMCGEIVFYIIYHGKKTFCWIYAMFWILIMLLGDSFSAFSCALLLSGLFGACMFGYGMPVRKSGLVSFGVIFIACLTGFFLCSDHKLRAVDHARQNMAHNIHELRYGKDQLPEGHLNEAANLQKSTKEMMKAAPEQKKSLYLKAYTGVVYEDGFWKKMPDSAYGGDNAGLLRWLKSKNFDPLKQTARYQKLSDKKNKVMSNHVSIQISKASKYYFYTPNSLEKVTKGKAKDKMDQQMISKGFFGQKKYEWDEVSSSRPSELTVAQDWVSHPKNAKQKEYSEAEAVYRKFVYDNYTREDRNLVNDINQIFWKDYDSKSDGIYSALNQVRTKLKEQYKYTKEPDPAPEGKDPLKWFLTQSHTGNQMLYASAAVEAFRVHGIPARYVEGYYLNASRMDNGKDGKVSITGKDAHAWVEVYFDGVGWKAVDVTPGYYYNVATLQKMVNTPEQIKKNAALKNNGYKGKQTTDSGKNERNLGKKLKKTVENTALLLLGILALLIILASLFIVLVQIRLWIMERRWRDQYEQSDMNGKVRILQKEIYGILAILGVEAKLGWKTKETDQIISSRFDLIEEGDYERVSALMEKTIYGEIALELYEERTIRVFRDKLWQIAGTYGWREKLKMKYQYQKYCGS